MNVRLSLALVALALCACPPSNGKTDGGVAPIITSVTPTTGPVTGGTLVTVSGANFSTGATVKFDDVLGTQVTVESDKRITALTPAVTMAGRVAVHVTNPDGKRGSLADAFTFEGMITNRVIETAVLQNPADATDASGQAMVAVAVTAQVQVANVTRGVGQGTGLRAQVGFATTVSSTPTSSDFTWTDASYLGDADGPMPGDLARDAYSAMVTVPGATSGQLVYYLAARFSGDNGATWTIADRDGSSNGVTTAQLSRLTVTKASIDWCKLGGEAIEAPPMISLRGAAAGPTIYGQVYKMGVTSASGAGADIKGQLGYGMAGTDPSTWTWADAAFNKDSSGGSNDEFQAVLPNPGAGSYKFAFRFNHANGPWSYCDADGLANMGFTEAQAGSLTVTAAGIDNCVLQFPAMLETREGRPSGDVFGRVLSQGVTDGVGQGAGIEAQLGYGPASAMPSTWTWTAMGRFNVDATGGADEYAANLVGPAPGTYAYTYRFRYMGGAWAYCDLDGSMNGFQAGQAGVLTARADRMDCRLQSVSTFSTTSGAPVGVTVRVLGVATDGGSPVARVQVGVGTQNDNASASASWGWQDTPLTSVVMSEVEYGRTIYPAYTGMRAVSARASIDDGGTWTYCDLNGSDVNGYEVAQQYNVTVAAHADFDFCNLQHPSTADAGGGDYAFGQVYEPGLTPNASAPITAWLGLGAESEDPGLAWRWTPAPYFGVSGNNNEYRALVPASATANERYVFRFTRDGGSFCYGDLDGAQNGFSGGSNIGRIVP